MPICSFCHGSHGASKYAIVLMKGNERERERERERDANKSYIFFIIEELKKKYINLEVGWEWCNS